MKHIYIKPLCLDCVIAFDGVLCGSGFFEEYSKAKDDDNISDWL